ncbi:MAG: trigger factor [Candidatus Gracilibacteria bacterium]|nr:trigger factor [Candidatus Gracilibacteria bacterium]
MKIEKKLLPKSILELIIEEETKNIARERKHVLDYLKNTADVKGYRKGNVPEAIIIKKYGEDYINQMVIDHAIDHIYQDAVRQEKVVPVAQAEIVEVISESPLKFKAHVEILPEAKISDEYKKIKLKKTKIEVTDKEVEDALNDIQTRFTKFEDAEEGYTINMGDKVTIDTTGYDKDEKVLENTSMNDYPLVIGSNMLVPGFEEGLIGKKSGEEVVLDITFPADYHNTLFAGKETVFKVSIKKIEKSVKPEFDAEFIKQLRGKDLELEGFKALIKEEIRETKDMNARVEEEHKLIDELLKVTELELGDKLMLNQMDRVFDEIKENLTKDNLRMVDYLESLRITEEEYKDKNVRPVAKRRLEGELILHKLMEVEGTKVEDAEMDKEIETIMARFSSEDVVNRLKELYVPGNKYYEELRQRTAYRKLIDSFFE